MRDLMNFDPLFGFSDTITLKAAQEIDETLNAEYGTGLNTDKESFGYVANFYKALYGLQKAVYNIKNFDELELIEIVANAVHDGWSYAAYNMDDPQPEKKENRIRIANTPYCFLDEAEKEKGRVVARTLIEFVRTHS